jgi:molybdenum cofactor cytidylyltransferase
MKANSIDVLGSTGRVLCCTIFRAGGKKLLAKGHVISEEDTRMLETEGMKQVWVTELEEGEVGEDDAVMQVASEIGCGTLEIRPAPGGRANLFTTEACCVLVDDELLKQINCMASMAIATSINFSYARSGQRVATVKSTPFAVARQELEAMISIVKERGPILQARPIRSAAVALLYSDPLNGERARQLFEPVVRQRLAGFGIAPSYALAPTEDEASVARALEHLLRARPDRALPGSCGTRQSLVAGLQRRCSHRIRARLLPLRETKRRGLDASADTGPLSCLWLGSCLPGAWRIARLERSMPS